MQLTIESKSTQLIAGIGIPVDLEPESLTSGYVLKAQYFLPYNASQLRPTRLARDVDHIKVDKYGQAYESYDVEAKVKSFSKISHQPEDDPVHHDDDDVRLTIYQAFEHIFYNNNFDGRQCVMRAICEASRLHFAHESGLLGEIFHVLLL